jgi:uncharacterized protein
VKSRNQYIVPFGGLKEGVHFFDFEAGDEFFEEYDALEISNGHLDIHIDMIKESSLLTFDIAIKGKVYVQCDRCLDFYYQDIGFKGKLFVKFSERTEADDALDEVIFLHPGDNEINLKHYIYESISISMPYKRIHPDINGVSTCNKEMIMQLNKHHGKSGIKNENHTWDKLKDLLGTNNNI